MVMPHMQKGLDACDICNELVPAASLHTIESASSDYVVRCCSACAINLFDQQLALVHASST